MSDSLLKFLIAIFALHFAIFLYLSIKNRKMQHMFVSLTFALLLLSFSCRLWSPEMQILGHKLHTMLRVSAWMSTFIVFAMAVRTRITSHRQKIQDPPTLANVQDQNL